MSLFVNNSVKSVMTPDPVCIGKDVGIGKALDLMTKHSVRHLIVNHEGKLVGIVSKSDLEKFDFIRNLGPKNDFSGLSDTITVDKIMTRGVHTLYEDESVKDAAEMLTLGAYHALPVVNFDDEVIGIVSSTDLILYLLRCMRDYGT
jgi:CBS domain-containing protein